MVDAQKNDDEVNRIDESVVTESKSFLPTSGVEEEKVSEKDILKLANRILFVLAVLFVFAGVTELYAKGNALFETCKICLPSLASLVIGYYFGSSKSC